MAAVMNESMPIFRSLDPEGPGHENLIIWGKHRRGGERSKSPVASGNWRERLDPVYEDEPDCVLKIDKIFTRLTQGGYEHSVDIAKMFYLEYPALATWEVAERVGRTVGFVRLTLRGIGALAEKC